MTQQNDMQPSQVIDTLGELIDGLTAFAAKVPAQSIIALPGGVRPTEEAVESYEDIVYRFRDRAGVTFKALPPLFVNSLEAFEAGRVFDAVPPLKQAVEILVEAHKEEKVTFNKPEEGRIRDLYHRLDKLLPEVSKPEIDMPPPTSY